MEYKTETEIFSQFKALNNTYNYFNENQDKFSKFFDENVFDSITFLGSGSSYLICESSEIITKTKLNMNANALVAGDLMLNFPHYKNYLENTLLVAPSRSGSTTEVLLAVKKVKEKYNSPCISISAKTDSELSKIADLNIELPWAYDESVCQTRTVTNLYTASLLLINIINNDLSFKDDIKKTIDYGNIYLDDNKRRLEEVVDQFDFENVFVLADSSLQGIASEASLAYKEIARINSYYNHLLDVRHGPMVLVNDKSLIVMANSPYGKEYQKELIKDLKAKNAYVLNNGLSREKLINSDLHIEFPEVDYPIRGIYFIVINQLLAYYKAVKSNINPDQPEGLDSWINLN
ncbi:MAG: SIS domain-containing protein [Halanaerobiales bacterium]|nr:SIS domain-containing protein [Halanaerobiales bacterium]